MYMQYKLFNMAYNYKGMGLSMVVVVTGYDKTGLYYVEATVRRHAGTFTLHVTA